MSYWQIGDVRITKFVEKEMLGSVHRFLLLDATPEACKEIEWLKPNFMTENDELRLSVHAFVVETPSCATSSIPASATTNSGRMNGRICFAARSFVI